MRLRHHREKIIYKRRYTYKYFKAPFFWLLWQILTPTSRSCTLIGHHHFVNTVTDFFLEFQAILCYFFNKWSNFEISVVVGMTIIGEVGCFLIFSYFFKGIRSAICGNRKLFDQICCYYRQMRVHFQVVLKP